LRLRGDRIHGLRRDPQPSVLSQEVL
jgi:hypothetical protein